MSQGRLGITSQAARVVVKQPEMTMKTKPLPDPLYGLVRKNLLMGM